MRRVSSASRRVRKTGQESNPVAKHPDLEASLPHSLPQFAPASPLAPPRRSHRGPGRQLQPEAFDVDDQGDETPSPAARRSAANS